MLIVFVVVLMVVGLAIIGALYSLFGPFLGQLADIRQYNEAYYSALSSVERGMLALRYHGPGFEGESGSLSGQSLGNRHDVSPVDYADSSWNIRSRTRVIPAPGAGNTVFAFQGIGSRDYNALAYGDIGSIMLDIDTNTGSDSYYSGFADFRRSSGLRSVQSFVRLSPLLYDFYDAQTGLTPTLCHSGLPGQQCDSDGDRIDDDVMVDRSMEGYRDGVFFRLLPRVSVNYISGTVNTSLDTSIRESDVNRSHDNLATNDMTAGWGGNRTFSPVRQNAAGQGPSSHIVVAPGGVVSAIGGQHFSTLLGSSAVSQLQLLLSLARIVALPGGELYPYLEMRIEADAPIADAFYHLDGRGRVGEYDVQIYVKKPTSDRSLLGSFTVVF